MTKKALVLLADGFEEVEAVTPIDYLRRAGVEVTTASVSADLIVTGRWGGIRITADTVLREIAGSAGEWDAVILPGGIPGAENLAASKETVALLKEMATAGKLICAICASPAVVLFPLGLLDGKKFTCYPGMEEKLTDALWLPDRVVADGNIITSQGAGTAGEFAIAIIEKLVDEAAVCKIAEAILL
ncbi:MAG: DJ-1/PfpI family protein [Treponema sp.]|jgi:4-methyl-5(b-hydroxyethyl)-thiazole monophosphate biosynthesis|nr:DJ-1/PfpI family protein [Treponema sp.]